MPIKLDMGRAWNEAIAMLTANRQTVLVVAGVFFLLPGLILALFFPDAMLGPAFPEGSEPDMQRIAAEFSAWFGEVWWILALVTVFQAVGTLALYALLLHSARPTVGQAIGKAGTALLPYFATQILLAVGFGLIGGLIAMIGTAVPLAAVLLGMAAVIGAVYAFVKFALVGPAIAGDGLLNPVAALRRSWGVTKGNSLRLFGFFLLLGVAYAVVASVIGIALSAASLLGDDIGAQVVAVGNAVVSMVAVAVFSAATAAVFQQLAGFRAGQAADTFD